MGLTRSHQLRGLTRTSRGPQMNGVSVTTYSTRSSLSDTLTTVSVPLKTLRKEGSATWLRIALRDSRTPRYTDH